MKPLFATRKHDTLNRLTIEMARLRRRWARLLKHKVKIYNLTKGQR